VRDVTVVAARHRLVLEDEVNDITSRIVALSEALVAEKATAVEALHDGGEW
jgi:plasmid stability protein